MHCAAWCTPQQAAKGIKLWFVSPLRAAREHALQAPEHWRRHTSNHGAGRVPVSHPTWREAPRARSRRRTLIQLGAFGFGGEAWLGSVRGDVGEVEVRLATARM